MIVSGFLSFQRLRKKSRKFNLIKGWKIIAKKTSNQDEKPKKRASAIMSMWLGNEWNRVAFQMHRYKSIWRHRLNLKSGIGHRKKSRKDVKWSNQLRILHLIGISNFLEILSVPRQTETVDAFWLYECEDVAQRNDNSIPIPVQICSWLLIKWSVDETTWSAIFFQKLNFSKETRKKSVILKCHAYRCKSSKGIHKYSTSIEQLSFQSCRLMRPDSLKLRTQIASLP